MTTSLKCAQLCGRRAALAVALLAGVAAMGAMAQDYPQRPIRFIVPFAPGGANDIVARLIGIKLGERLGQQIVVDNRPSSTGVLGVELTVNAQPDGYTLLVGNTVTNGINPVLFAGSNRVNATRDLTGVSMLVAVPHAVIASSKLPPNNFAELIAYAKARPGELNYTAPLGGHPHLDMLALAAATGIKIVHLPSKGAGETLPALMRGEAHLSNTNISSMIGPLRAGQIKAYAVTSARRVPEIPELPTFTEVGLAGIGSLNWVALFAPVKTPRAIIDKLHATIVEVLSQPEQKESFAKRLLPLQVSKTPAELNEFVAAENQRWARIIRDNNIRME
jgi:tripartite-type tricarboxylate transporter receptor subunit TctC